MGVWLRPSKLMVSGGSISRQKNLELRIEKEPWDPENVLSYNFYDAVNKYPRINFKVKEENNNLHLDLLSF